MTQPHTLIARLDGARQIGPDRWQAKCPAHEDRNPSLSIRVTDDRLLVHCFSGCAPGDILAAVGLSWADLFADKWQAAERAHLAFGHKQRVKMLSQISQVDYARYVLKIAAADIERGIEHGIEDRATIEVARRIMQGGRGHE